MNQGPAVRPKPTGCEIAFRHRLPPDFAKIVAGRSCREAAPDNRPPSLYTLSFPTMSSSKTVQQLATRLIPRSILFGNPERSEPAISPDGTQLAYLAPVNGVLNVWIRTLGQSDDRPVTADTNRGIHVFAWQYDNRHILYAQDADGDENWRVYQTDIATRQTRNLTPFEKVQASIVAYEWDKPGDDAGANQPARRKPVRCPPAQPNHGRVDDGH